MKLDGSMDVVLEEIRHELHNRIAGNKGFQIKPVGKFGNMTEVSLMSW